MALSRTVALRLLVGSVVVTFAAAAVALLAMLPWLWIVVVLGIVTFWFAVFQLIADVGRRARAAMRDFAAEFRAAVGADGRAGAGSGGRTQASIELGELKPID